MREKFQREQTVNDVDEIHKLKFIKMLEKFMCTYGHILHRLNLLLGTKLDFLLVRFTVLPAHVSLWLKRSGTTTWTLIALLSTVLLRRMDRVTT